MMKHKIPPAIVWLFIGILGLGIITDFLMVLFGLPRVWQWLYNGVAFVCIVALLIVALGDKIKNE